MKNKHLIIVGIVIFIVGAISLVLFVSQSRDAKAFTTTISVDRYDMFNRDAGHGFQFVNYKINFDTKQFMLLDTTENDKPDIVVYEKLDKTKSVKDLTGRKDFNPITTCGLSEDQEGTGYVIGSEKLGNGRFVIIDCHADGGDNPFITLAFVPEKGEVIAKRFSLDDEKTFCRFDEEKLIENLKVNSSSDQENDYQETVDFYRSNCE